MDCYTERWGPLQLAAWSSLAVRLGKVSENLAMPCLCVRNCELVCTLLPFCLWIFCKSFLCASIIDSVSGRHGCGVRGLVPSGPLLACHWKVAFHAKDGDTLLSRLPEGRN
jgi:hypothetical protein